jgi:two-component system, cell cycle sensor histidine kinase and response regulator CckA
MIDGASRVSGTILVIEDQETVRDLVVRVLNHYGLEVSAHADATLALEYARIAEHHFDLVLTDVAMPGMGGPSLVEALCKLRPSVPIVFTSGLVDDMGHSNETASAREFFLAKPFTPIALMGKVQSILERSRRDSASTSG